MAAVADDRRIGHEFELGVGHFQRFASACTATYRRSLGVRLAFGMPAAAQQSTAVWENSIMNVIATHKFAIACSTAAGLVIAAACLLVVSQTAVATTQFA